MEDRAELLGRLARLEEQLRDSEARLRYVLEVAKIGGWELDLATHTAVWSPETRQVLGVGPEVPARPETVLARCVDDTDRTIVRDALANVRAGLTRYAITYRVRGPTGTPRVIHSRAEVRNDDRGQPARLVGIVQDVTELEQLRAQLVHSQKMETVGRLAAGVAHDLNNMLTIIHGSCEFLETASGSAEAGQDVATLRDAATRATALTRGLLAFTRQQVLQPESVDVNELLGALRKMLARLLGPAIHLDLRTPRSLGAVTADREQLTQVIVNLVVNARDAMPAGGRLTIETDEGPVPGGPPTVPHAHVAVTDTGHGMTPEVMSRIFEPFFTTKGSAGTGLGLSSAYGVISQSGGVLTVRSTPERGTTFDVYLPVTSRVVVPPRPLRPAAIEPTAPSRRTVLLVEDDEHILRLSKRVLERAGFDVVTAGRGLVARDLVQQGLAFDVLVTDTHLPDLDGREVAAAVRNARPDVPLLFVSGYAGGTDLVARPGETFLPKPYTPTQLVDTVRRIVRAPPA